jgi:NADPH-dependent glutamate synthase beta subunit-like oxidoreductase
MCFPPLTPLSGTERTLCRIQTRSHESAKKATLQIRFVIVGGGAAGLSCAVALRRVGHQVIVLEKGSNFIGVRTTAR